MAVLELVIQASMSCADDSEVIVGEMEEMVGEENMDMALGRRVTNLYAFPVQT